MNRRIITLDRMSDKDRALHTTASEVAGVLGWVYEAPTEDEDGNPTGRAYCWNARLHNGAGLAIHMHSMRAKGRIEIGHGLDIPQAVSRYGLEYPKITVAADRAPMQIASEIKRRMVTGLEALRLEVEERTNRHGDYTAETDRSAAMIAAQGAELRGRDNGSHERELYGPMNSHMRVSGSSVRFEHFSVPAEVGARIVALLREHAAKDGAA